eukprot:3316911-Lingulodinium_polyedra.AAC.1
MLGLRPPLGRQPTPQCAGVCPDPALGAIELPIHCIFELAGRRKRSPLLPRRLGPRASRTRGRPRTPVDAPQ